MFNIFNKKKGEENDSSLDDDNLKEQKGSDEEKTLEESNNSKSLKKSDSDSISLTKFSSEIERLKVGIEGFAEVRKSFSERFSRVSEQIGELRSMILERDKSIQEIELKSIKSYDLVEAVHPEKISTEIQKQDAKLEALKANLEGNESIMERVMEELKETKRKVEFFRGVEEIIKLSEEVKKELIEIKKIESRININTDKVETLYGEIREKFKDIDSFKSELQNISVQVEQNTKDVSFLKEKSSNMVEKEELERLVKKVENYIEALKSIEKKSSLTKDVDQLKFLLEGLK